MDESKRNFLKLATFAGTGFLFGCDMGRGGGSSEGNVTFKSVSGEILNEQSVEVQELYATLKRMESSSGGESVGDILLEVGEITGVPADIVLAVVQMESGGVSDARPYRRDKYGKLILLSSALGLMQPIEETRLSIVQNELQKFGREGGLYQEYLRKTAGGGFRRESFLQWASSEESLVGSTRLSLMIGTLYLRRRWLKTFGGQPVLPSWLVTSYYAGPGDPANGIGGANSWYKACQDNGLETPLQMIQNKALRSKLLPPAGTAGWSALEKHLIGFETYYIAAQYLRANNFGNYRARVQAGVPEQLQAQRAAEHEDAVQARAYSSAPPAPNPYPPPRGYVQPYPVSHPTPYPPPPQTEFEIVSELLRKYDHKCITEVPDYLRERFSNALALEYDPIERCQVVVGRIKRF